MGKSSVLSIVAVLAMAVSAWADDIYLLGQGYVDEAGAAAMLTADGHTVTLSTTALADYSAYDQVWDIRHSPALSGGDIAAYDSFLSSGGRMYFTGEWSAFATRNTSIESFLEARGSGNITFTAAAGSTWHTETVIAPGFAPGEVQYYASNTMMAPGNGFVVTEFLNGEGSAVGWDFGDLGAFPDSRVLFVTDINIFGSQGAQYLDNTEFVQSMAVWLGAGGAAEPVPEPGTLALLGVGVAGIVAARRRKKAKA